MLLLQAGDDVQTCVGLHHLWIDRLQSSSAKETALILVSLSQPAVLQDPVVLQQRDWDTCLSVLSPSCDSNTACWEPLGPTVATFHLEI